MANLMFGGREEGLHYPPATWHTGAKFGMKRRNLYRYFLVIVFMLVIYSVTGKYL